MNCIYTKSLAISEQTVLEYKLCNQFPEEET